MCSPADFPQLAKGSYGTVYKGHVPGRDKVVVIKDMDLIDNNSINEWKKELAVMAYVLLLRLLTCSENASDYVGEVYGYASDYKSLTIVMEFMSKGDLFSVLHTVQA